MINELQTIQNAAARIVTFRKKTDHITPVLRKLNWLPVQYRIIFKILLLVYKGLNGLVPIYISEHKCERLHYRASSRLLCFTKTLEHSKDISEDIYMVTEFFQLLAAERTTFTTQIIKHFDCFQKGLQDLFV